jgi:hypothetical protein
MRGPNLAEILWRSGNHYKITMVLFKLRKTRQGRNPGVLTDWNTYTKKMKVKQIQNKLQMLKTHRLVQHTAEHYFRG